VAVTDADPATPAPTRRVPIPTWAILVATLVYIASPVDALPMCPIDDVVVALIGGAWAAVRQLRPAGGAP
jgi:uncharacterized membrane protein YkvA (DUF1232 family)